MVKAISKSKVILGITVLAVAFAALCAVILSTDITLADATHMVNVAIDMLSQTHPFVFFLAIALLPLIGCPVSPLLIAGGLAYGPVIGMVVALAGMAVNNALGYWLAASVFREWIEKLIQKRNWRIPVVPDQQAGRVVVMFRLTPGFPLPAQNYILGLARVPFFTYFWISIAIQTIPAAGFVLTGGSIFEGSWGLVFVGVSLIVVMAVAAKIILSYYGKQIARPNPAES